MHVTGQGDLPHFRVRMRNYFLHIRGMMHTGVVTGETGGHLRIAGIDRVDDILATLRMQRVRIKTGDEARTQHGDLHISGNFKNKLMDNCRPEGYVRSLHAAVCQLLFRRFANLNKDFLI